MNLSAEKRKMPRMRLNLSTFIFSGIANSQACINIQNLSIHGISFLSKRNFIQGATFSLVMPHYKNDSAKNKIQAEVVRCETLNGSSSKGRFQIGARFLFPSHRSTEAKEKLSPENPSHLQSIDSQNLPLIETLPVSSASQMRVKEIRAELIQSVRTPTTEETIYTRIQIKQTRFIASPSLSSPMSASFEETLPKISKAPLSENLSHQFFPYKQLP